MKTPPYLKKSLFSTVFCLFFIGIQAQDSAIYTENNLAYKKAMNLYDEGIVGLAQTEFKKVVEALRPINEPESILLRTKAELFFAKCAVRLNQPDGERLIIDFARTYDPDPLANQAILEMADFYFNSKDYARAAELFASIDAFDLGRDQRSEVKFKLGYAYFVKKKFREARIAFGEIRDIQNEYYYPSNYYYGMTSFYEDKYNEAIASFEKVERSKKYQPYVPYYITQIYFAQGKYDDVIKYAVNKTKDEKLKNRPEVNQLVGQAYFEKGDYRKALPYLEYYADNAKQLRAEDLYQLGYVHYQDKNYQQAIIRLEELGTLDSEMGQSAMYALADSYLKIGNKTGARNAFRAASRMDYDDDIQEESNFNFAKLSYELNFDREAITALEKIDPSSSFHAEAQTLLSSIFLNTRDYDNALATIEKLPNLSPALKETYQKVAYFKGIQLYREGEFEEAKKRFNQSLENPIDNRTKALSYYWLGEIAHQEEDFQTSTREINKFLALSKNLKNLPDESSVHTANYIQGYNYLEQEDYNGALGYFERAATGIKNNALFISNPIVAQKIQGDAILRSGDAYFKRNQYDNALEYYNTAVDQNHTGFVYALYQKAIIEGLKGNQTNKIIALDDLVENHPNSEYADNALMQLGITYLEISKLDKASQPLKELLEKYPNSNLRNQALLKLGLISYNQGSLEEAANYYKQVFGNNPTEKEGEAALTALEEIYVDDLAQPDVYFAFLETIPGYKVEADEKESINFKAAASQYENGNYKKAIISLNNYIRLYPAGKNIIKAYFYRGDAHTAEKEYSEALRDFEKVIDKGNSSYYVKALDKAAIIAYYHEEDYEKSYDLYNKLESATDKVDTRLEAQEGALSSAYLIGNSEAVLNYADKVLKNPDVTTEQRALANFYLGKIAFDKEDYLDALRAFNEVTRTSNNEETAEARYLIAYIYYVQRDLEVAEQITLNAQSESSEYPYWAGKSIILLADILAEKGDVLNARAVLEGWIESYTEDEELLNIARKKLEALKAREASSNRLITTPVDTETLDLIEEQ